MRDLFIILIGSFILIAGIVAFIYLFSKIRRAYNRIIKLQSILEAGNEVLPFDDNIPRYFIERDQVVKGENIKLRGENSQLREVISDLENKIKEYEKFQSKAEMLNKIEMLLITDNLPANPEDLINTIEKLLSRKKRDEINTAIIKHAIEYLNQMLPYTFHYAGRIDDEKNEESFKYILNYLTFMASIFHNLCFINRSLMEKNVSWDQKYGQFLFDIGLKNNNDQSKIGDLGEITTPDLIRAIRELIKSKNLSFNRSIIIDEYKIT